MIKRIQEIIAAKSITVAELETELREEKGSLAEVFEGKNVLTATHVQAVVARFPDVDANWLLTGRGSMFHGKLEQAELLAGDCVYPEPLLDLILANVEVFRREPKIDAVVALFSNFKQQRVMEEMYDKIARYEELLKE